MVMEILKLYRLEIIKKEFDCLKDVILYVRYVDDTLMCVPTDMIDYTVKIFNSFDLDLQFTVEIEKENKISFLDLFRKFPIKRRELNFKIRVSIYRLKYLTLHLKRISSNHTHNNRLTITSIFTHARARAHTH